MEAWDRFLEEHIAFLEDMERMTDIRNISGNTFVHVPFLQDTLSNRARMSNQIVSEKEVELQKIFRQIDDIIPLDVFSREVFDEQMHQAEKVRKDTLETVYELDRQLVKEYQVSEIQQDYAKRLFEQIRESSRKNGVVSPLNFDLQAYHNSEIYRMKTEMEKQEKKYIDIKDKQDFAWDDALEEEEKKNRPWYEKVWSGVLIGSGNAVEGTVEGFKGIANFGERLDNLAHPALFSGENLLKYANDVGYFLKAAVSVKDNWRSCINMPKYILNAVISKIERDVFHGDAESRTAFFTYGLTSLGLSILGENGISKIGSITKLDNIVAKSGEYIPKINNSPEFALAGTPVARKPIPYNVLNDLLTQIKTRVDEVFGSGKGANKNFNMSPRNMPGDVTENFKLERSLQTQNKLMYNNGAIGVIPYEIRNKLIGKHFNSFDDFRKEFWKSIANSSFAKEFNNRNVSRMLEGNAPIAPKSEHYGKHKSYILHHKQPIDKGGEVYSLDNLMITSPKMHQNILDPTYHFGKKGTK